MQARSVAKLSISLPRDLARSVRRRVGKRALSAFAARAMSHELERAQLGDYLAEMEAELGPIADGLVRQARAAWRKS